MEEKHKELLQQHRAKFIQSIDVTLLLPFLEVKTNNSGGPPGGALTSDDITAITSHSNRQDRVETFLEILPTKSPQSFQLLCLALEKTYPHLLTVMLGLTKNYNRIDTGSQSPSSSLSDDDDGLHDNTEPAEGPESEDDSSGPENGSDTTSSYSTGVNTIQDHIDKSNLALLKQELKLTVNERDTLRDELQKTRKKLDQYMDGFRSDINEGNSYDWLKMQWEGTMSELQAMKRQHSDTAKKCDMTSKEADYYRAKYKSVHEKLKQTTVDGQTYKSQYSEQCGENERLKQEVKDLQARLEVNEEEIKQLHSQQREVISQPGSSEVLNKMYDTTLDRYEATKRDYEKLRKRHQELITSHSEAVTRLEFLQKDIEMLKKQNEDITKEKEMVIIEKNGLQQQCTAAIRNWDNVLRDRNELREQMSRITQQRNEALQSMALQVQSTKDLGRVKNERDDAIREYKLIMSERDSVHSEIEQLQDKLTEATRRIDAQISEGKLKTEEIDNLKRELGVLIKGRDLTIHECNELRKEFDEIASARGETQKERDVVRKDNEMLTHQRDIARKERNEAIEDRDRLLHDTYKMKQDTEQIDKETADSLKKEIERLQTDWKESQEENKEMRKKRDWAFNERDKIVQERESIRAHCDMIRKDRDRAVTELAENLRETDELKKHKSDAVKEAKELREKYEALIEGRKSQLNSIGNNHSRDSAIDTDLQDWETETLEFDIGCVEDENMGFELDELPNDSGIYVSNVLKGSGAEGKLKINDHILKINNVEISNAEKKIALQALKNSDGIINMVVRRRKSLTTKAVIPVHLNLNGERDVGLQLEHGVYITKINSSSPAAKESNLAVGDRVLLVNGRQVDGKSIKDVQTLIQNAGNLVTLNVQKINPVPTSNIRDLLDSSLSEQELGSSSNKPRSRMPFSPSQQESLEKYGKQSSVGEMKEHSKSKTLQTLEKTYRRVRNRLRGNKIKDDSKSTPHIYRDIESPSDDIEGALNLLDNAIEPHEHTMPLSPSNPTRKSDRKKEKPEKENGGTWPRTRPAELSLVPAATVTQMTFGSSKQRPTLDVITQRNSTLNSSSRSNAPIPPDRLPSSYAAAMRHSPQNSHYSGSPTKINPFMSPIGTSHQGTPSKSLSNGSGTKRTITDLQSDSSSSLDHRKNPLHYPNVGSPIGTPDYFAGTPSSDYSINSDKDILHKHNTRNQVLTSSGRRRPKHGGGRRYRTPNNHQASFTLQSPLYPSQTAGYTVSPTESKPYYSQFNTLPSKSSSNFAQGNASWVSNPNQSYPSAVHNGMYSPSTVSPRVRPIEMISSTPQKNRLSSVGYSTSPSPSNYSTSTGDRATPRSDNFPYDLIQPQEKTPIQYTHHTYADGGATFPRNTGRFRIPSKSSIISSERSSPLSPLCSDSASSITPYIYTKPRPGEPRTITIERKSDAEQLGICIKEQAYGKKHGIFVSSVAEKSPAALFGIHEGDQLLEVCGINMRSASYGHAASVLRNCGNSIDLYVQYNPKKYTGQIDAFSDGESSFTASPPTSPELKRHGSNVSGETITPRNHPCNASGSSQKSRDSKHSSQNSQSKDANYPPCEPRFVFLPKTTPGLGVKLTGGNACGIFVHEVLKDSSAAGINGLRCGDQILEFNGVDLRSATGEQAALELSKPTDTVTVLAQYNMPKYNKIQATQQGFGGDAFYIRALFGRRAEIEGELTFVRDDVLYIENTVYNDVVGLWKAWLVDDEGNKLQSGTIPSKIKMENEVSLKRSLSEAAMEDELKSARRGSASSRRSFFRKNKHKRNNSKDSRELHSFSDISISASESVPILDDGTVLTYQRVERLDYNMCRPVIILSPLAEALIVKLSSESLDKYRRVKTEQMKASIPVMEKGQADGHFIDYKRIGDCYECITVDAVKQICDNNRHPLLNVSPYAIERLHRLQIYPIVIFVQHKSPKQIRDVKDVRFLPEKMTNREAKEQFDLFQKNEKEFRHLFTTIIPGGNLACVGKEIKQSIDTEQKKTIWIPGGSL